MRRGDLERDQHGRAQRRDLHRRLAARHERHQQREPGGHPLDHGPERAQVVLAPDREGRVAADLVAQRPVIERAQAAVRHERQERQRERERHDHREQQRAAPAVARAGGGEQGPERQRHELGRGAEPDQQPSRWRAAERHQRPDEHRRHERVVRVRVERVERVRVRGPRVGQGHAERGPFRPGAQPATEHEQPEQRREVEEDRGAVRGRHVVPLAAPRQRLLERDVHEVVDRPVRVAVLVVGREVPLVQRLAVDDVVGPDRARIADVDHVGVGDVQGDAEADQENQRGREVRGLCPGQRAAGCGPRAAEPQPEQPRQQIQQHGICERNRLVDLAPVEEEVGCAEGEQDEQVEVQHRRPSAHERREEQHAQGQPDVRRVELAGEGAGIAARHLPRDLRAGPRFQHRAAAVVDRDLRTLGSALEVAHLPLEQRALEVRVARHRPALVPFGNHLRVAVGDRDHLSRRVSVPRRRLGRRRRELEVVGAGRRGGGEQQRREDRER